jgi:hypothetical protein
MLLLSFLQCVSCADLQKVCSRELGGQHLALAQPVKVLQEVAKPAHMMTQQQRT